MNRYSSLCVFVIIFALLESIVAAPEGDPVKGEEEQVKKEGDAVKGSSSDGENPASCSQFANRVGKALWGKIAPWKEIRKWEDVTFLVIGREEGTKGKLKAGKSGEVLSYRFYQENRRGEIKYIFKRKNLENPTREGTVVNCIIDRTKCVLTFANDTDAEEFVGGKHD